MDAAESLHQLQRFELGQPGTLAGNAMAALHNLWNIFEQLSYSGARPVRAGLAGSVGIAKATLLLTDGQVGPAFDRTVRAELGIAQIENADQWIAALGAVMQDVNAFEDLNGVTLQQASLHYGHLNAGRIYDMALGPR